MRPGDCLDSLAEATLPELVELRAVGHTLSPADLRAVARSPVLRQLRHLCVWPGNGTRAEDIRAIADALDPGRVETLAFYYVPLSPGCRRQLRRRFGDRVRL